MHPSGVFREVNLLYELWRLHLANNVRAAMTAQQSAQTPAANVGTLHLIPGEINAMSQKPRQNLNLERGSKRGISVTRTRTLVQCTSP